MKNSIGAQNVFKLDFNSSLIPAVVERIKETYGKAYSAFSGRPISLCKSLERRGELRMKFEEPIYLWSVDTENELAICQQSHPTVAITKDISTHGVGFSYDEDFETEHVIVEFDLFGEGTEYLLVEVRWSTSLAAHSYVGGGLIKAIATVAH
jgi:hypothetical protein